MTKHALSLILKCWHDPQTDQVCLQALRTDTNEKLPLFEGSFLLRLMEDEAMPGQRCLLKHIASGREIYLQSGPGLSAFFTSCLFPEPEQQNEHFSP